MLKADEGADPQVTTEPLAVMAANAAPDPQSCTTVVSLSRTSEQSPPQSSSPHVTTEPSPLQRSYKASGTRCNFICMHCSDPRRTAGRLGRYWWQGGICTPTHISRGPVGFGRCFEVLRLALRGAGLVDAGPEAPKPSRLYGQLLPFAHLSAQPNQGPSAAHPPPTTAFLSAPLTTKRFQIASGQKVKSCACYYAMPLCQYTLWSQITSHLYV